MRFTADQHLHSAASPDAKDTVEAICQSAMQKDLSVIAVTDHCEANAYIKEGFDRSILLSGEQTALARRKYNGRLEVLRGLELGQATQCPEDAEKALSARTYDLVLASLHNLAGRPDFFYMDFQKTDPAPLFRQYLTEMAEIVRWGKFDVLAHLTYPLRYIVGKCRRPFGLAPFAAQLDDLLRELARAGKGLEINTSGFRQGLGTSMPGEALVRRFRELGGQIITFGSDAHRASDVGAGISDGMDLALRAGFTSFAVYRRHKPYFYPL